MGFVFKSQTLPWSLDFGKILMNGIPDLLLKFPQSIVKKDSERQRVG